MLLPIANNKTLDTESLPAGMEPMFCSSCGGRIGWYASGITDEPCGYCDECAADLRPTSDEEEESE
jgi:hypothetical protein